MNLFLKLTLASVITASNLSASGFFNVNYTQINKDFYNNETQNGGGFGFGAIYDTSILNSFVEVDFSGNGSTTYRSTATFGIEKNVLQWLHIGVGYGYTHLVAHSKSQNVGTFVAKAEYDLSDKYFLGYKYLNMFNVSPYYNLNLDTNEKKDINSHTMYIGFRF